MYRLRCAILPGRGVSKFKVRTGVPWVARARGSRNPWRRQSAPSTLTPLCRQGLHRMARADLPRIGLR
eukprot:4620242-Pyramimonas_sp.AAC.1